MSASVIELHGLSRRFGEKLALNNISLNVPRGTVFGLVGENGAGKTTLIRHVLGLCRAQSGQVSVFDKDPVADPVGVLSRIGYLSEERDLPDWMTIGELMHYTQAFYANWDETYANELRQTFELAEKQRVKTLSRGQRARAGLLIALAHRPELLLLDEPSSGLDAVVRRDILGAIIRTVADEGRTVLFSSHLLDEVERVCDQVAMIHQGQMVLCDAVATIVQSHRRLTLRYGDAQQSPPALPGGLSCTGAGREWTYLCNGERDRLMSAAVELGAEVVDEEAASLDEIFVARVKQPQEVQP